MSRYTIQLSKERQETSIYNWFVDNFRVDDSTYEITDMDTVLAFGQVVAVCPSKEAAELVQRALNLLDTFKKSLSP